MAVTVLIPTALRSYAQDLASIACEGDTVGAALHSLTAQHPGLANHLRGKDGRLRSFVNVYCDDEDIRYLQGEATVVAPGAVITIVPSIAGGRS